MTQKSTITINPKVRDHFSSINSAVVFNRLVYWSNKKPDGFYKFKQPSPKNRLYKYGDSWQEELGMSRKTLDSAMSPLVTTFKSKKQFLAEKDKFKGKIFASYTNRTTYQTFYLIDKHALEAFYTKLGIIKPPSSPSVSNAPIPAPLETTRNDPPALPFAHTHLDPSFNTTITTLPQEKLISIQMVETWNKYMNDTVKWYDSTSGRLCQILKDFFKGCLETFKRYCLTCASADFLMGKAKNSSFKAYLFWAIQPETIQKILDGAYGVKDFFTIKTPEERQLDAEKKRINQEIKVIDDKISIHQREVLEGQRKLIVDLRAAVSSEDLYSWHQESDKEFNASLRDPNAPQDRDYKRFSDMKFVTFLDKKIKERVGITDEIKNPQHLVDKRASLMAERKIISDKLNLFSKDYQRFQTNRSFNC